LPAEALAVCSINLSISEIYDVDGSLAGTVPNKLYIKNSDY
jgi:hypothetical protein